MIQNYCVQGIKTVYDFYQNSRSLKLVRRMFKRLEPREKNPTLAII